MKTSEEIIQDLEIKRRALNERLMHAKDVTEANSIERELWALRALIRYHKSRLSRVSQQSEPPKSINADRP